MQALLNGGHEGSGFEWTGDEFRSSKAVRFDLIRLCHPHGGDNDWNHGQLRILLQHSKQIETTGREHMHIGNDEVRVVRAGEVERLLG